MAFPFGFMSKLFNRDDKPQHTRRFDGAAGGRRGWGASTMGRLSTETALAGPTLRSRARYLACNDPYLSHGVSNWVGALVGAGIEATGDPEAVAAHSLWADQADADSRTDFRGLQAEIARSMVVDGEAFLQLIDSPEGPRVRHLPAELIDESLTRDLGNGRFIVSGIEFNPDGTRAAYHVLSARPTDLFATSGNPVRIPANEILHIFKPLGPGQVRGVSWLAPVILPAGELNQLCDALLVGTKTAAMFAGFLTNLNEVGVGDPFDGEAHPSLEPGTLQRLAGGWDIKFATPGQAAETASFLRFNLQQLAAGLGLPDHLLSGDLSRANYSSLRAGLLPFRQRVEQIQYHTLVPQLLNPVWRAVMADAALRGDLDGYESDPSRFLKVEWLPPAFMQVDPEKQVKADIAELEAGLTSRRKLVAQRGWDMAELDAEIALDSRKPQGGNNAA